MSFKEIPAGRRSYAAIADDRKPAPEVYLIGGRMSENRQKHPRGRKIVSTFF